MTDEKIKQKIEIRESLYETRGSNIAFLGAGNLARSVAQGLIIKKVKTLESLVLSNRTFEKMNDLAEAGFNTFKNNSDAVVHANTVCLTVKPWQVLGVLKETKPFLTSDKLVISLAAGLRIKEMRKIISDDITIVRAMPNIASKFGIGVTGWYSDKELTVDQQQTLDNMFGALGISIRTQTEEGIDKITGVAGSMIALLFYMSEVQDMSTLQSLDGEVSIEQALQIAQQVRKGASYMLENDGRQAAELRTAVTSDKGTTAEALSFLEHNKLAQIFHGGVLAAINRSIEIGDSLVE